MIDNKKIVFSIFTELKLPFISVDINKIKQANERNYEIESFIAIQIERDTEILEYALKGLLNHLPDTNKISLLLEKSDFQFKEKYINSFNSETNKRIPVKNLHKLVWNEYSLRPLAYSSLINQLVSLSKFFKLMIEERIKDLRKTTNQIDVDVISEYNKNMPTEIHNAFASLGSYLGGSSNFEYLSYYATKYQLYKPLKNIDYAKKINYSNNEAQDLDNSGIIAIPISLAVSLFPLVKSKNVLGSIPIDEINLINMPNKTFSSFFNNQKKEDVKIPGFIMDKYYRSIFTGHELSNKCALYGTNDVMRDHYTEFYSTLKDNKLLRCKHYSIPIINVNNIDEIYNHISSIPKRGNSGLFFRGQTSFYEINRTQNVKNLLFGDSNSCEPSLITSASRLNFNYDNLHFSLKYFLEHHLLFKKYKNKIDKKNILSNLSKMNESVLCEIDYGIMALAQHYGLPTHGLDVTTNLDVAIWFATNKFKKDKNICSYEKISKEKWSDKEEKWPMIFVFQNVLNSTSSSLQDCKELDKLGIKALRPERQNAKFFHGAHTDHQNRLAESLVCAFRLCPNDYETKVDFEYLFPSPEEDVAYKFMIEFSKNNMFLDFEIHQTKVANYHD